MQEFQSHLLKESPHAMIESHAFVGKESGIRLLVLGAVHGNEKCGTFAIRRVIEELETGKLEIERGAVTFVPICNPRAFDADQRFVDRNLNRFFVRKDSVDYYEDGLVNALVPLLESCDALLDIHSYTAGGAPFVFLGSPGTKEHEFANALGASFAMTGWQAAYAASGGQKQSVDPNESTGTTECARKFGAIAVTIECGQHRDAQAPEIAYKAILNALRFWGLLGGSVEVPQDTRLIEVKRVFHRGHGENFVKDWKHMEPVKKGDIIALGEQGEAVRIPDDGYLVMPHADVAYGGEWFYLGQEK